MNQQYLFQDADMVESKSSWEEMFGCKHDYRTAKSMFKKSVLLPPPQRMQEDNFRVFFRRTHEQKVTLNSIFKRLKINNFYMHVNFLKNGYFEDTNFLSEDDCEKFVKDTQPQLELKLKKLCSQCLALCREGEYNKMEDMLRNMDKWIKKVEERVKEKFKCKMLQAIEIKQRKNQFANNKKHHSPIKSTISSTTYYDKKTNEEKTTFDMSVLNQQIDKIAENENSASSCCTFTSDQMKSMYRKSCWNRESDGDNSGDDSN